MVLLNGPGTFRGGNVALKDPHWLNVDIVQFAGCGITAELLIVYIQRVFVFRLERRNERMQRDWYNSTICKH